MDQHCEARRLEVLRTPEQQLHRHLPHRHLVHAQGREGRGDVLRELDVIEAQHRELLRDGAPRLACGLHRGDRHVIIAPENGGDLRVLLQQRARRFQRRAPPQWTIRHVMRGNAMIEEGLLITPVAVGDARIRPRSPSHQRDVTMSPLDQVAHAGVSRLEIVAQHGVIARGVSVSIHQNQGQAPPGKRQRQRLI